MKQRMIKKLSSIWRGRKVEIEQGSSLLEVTIALLVSNIGLLGMAQLIAVATVTNKNSSNMVESARAAQNAIEPLRSTDFASVATTSKPTTVTYKERFNVTTSVLEDSTNAKKILVTVEDTNYDMKGGKRSFSFVNYRTRDKDSNGKDIMGSYYNNSLTPEQVKASANTGNTTGS